MINVKKFTPPILVLVGAVCLTACALEEQVEPAEEAYTKAFIKEFGLIASDQDWNMATQGSVTVNTGSATNVKIYALVDGTYRLVGNYADVTGTQTLTFDIPKGVEDIRVENPTYSYNVKVGETVSFVGTRTSHTGTTNNIKVENLEEPTDKPLTLTQDDVFVYAKTLVEGKNNLSKTGVTKNFTLSGVTSFNIYPIYWNTSQTLTVGVYYTDDNNNIVKVPVYTIKDTDTNTARLLIKRNYAEETGTASNTYNSATKSNNSFMKLYELVGQECWKSGKLTDDDVSRIINGTEENIYGLSYYYGEGVSFSGLKIEKKTDWDLDDGTKIYGGTLSYTYKKSAVVDKDWTFNYEKNSNETLANQSIPNSFVGTVLSKGIKVTVPNNLKFGMYVTYTNKTTNKEQTYYSEKKYNPDNACHAATYEYTSDNETIRYLGFEDWDGADGSDFDLNDFVLRIDNLQSTSITDEGTDDDNALGWIIACEDLGSTDDYDFNDIVLHVSYVTNSDNDEKIDVTLKVLAAGGVLPAMVYLDGYGEDKTYGEVHEILGETASSSGQYPMINTNSITNTAKSSFTKKKSFYEISNSQNTSGKTKLCKIRIKVGSGTDAVTIKAPTEGEAPQMFIVPDTWKWPKERVNIKDAYPKFTDWGKNNNGASYDWYTDRTGATGEVVER